MKLKIKNNEEKEEIQGKYKIIREKENKSKYDFDCLRVKGH